MKKIILIISILISCCANAQLSLDSCQSKARRNFPLIHQLDLIEKTKELNVSNAVRGYLPKLNILGIAGYVDGLPDFTIPGMTSSSGNDQFKLIGIVQLNQPIWDGGYSRAQKISAETNAEVEKQQIEVQFHQLKERVNQIFFGLLMIDEQLTLQNLLNDNLNKTLENLNVAYSQGAAKSADLDMIKVEILQVQQQKVTLQSQRKTYAGMLSYMINEPVDDNTKLQTPEIDTTVLYQEIHRVEQDLYQKQIDFFQAQNKLLNAQIMPKVGLMGFAVGLTPEMDVVTSSINHLLIAGVSLSWNIDGLYTRGNDKNVIKTNIEKIQNQNDVFIYNTTLQQSQQKSDIDKWKGLLITDEEVVALRENIRKTSEVKYENGVYTMTDLIRDMNAETLARQTMAIHKMEYLMSLYNYKLVIGDK